MDFLSPFFLGFVFAAALVQYALPTTLRPYWLLAASLVFFGWEAQNCALFGVLGAVAAVTWLCSLALEACRAKPLRIFLLTLAGLSSLGCLVYTKYSGLLAESWLALTGSEGPLRTSLFLAPLGLAYFSLAAFGYCIDVYRRRYPAERNPFLYLLFVSFFPAVFTGPIGRYDLLGPQLRAPRGFDYGRMAGGAFRILWGYAKKLVLADNLALFVKSVYGDPASFSGPVVFASALVFSMQIYMDFSGSCDIALGTARLLGVDLSENFRSPFLATSFAGLWSRWHMSLTGWFRDYLYIPLGGSRCGRLRHSLNLILVFVASGLWHGAAWGYAVWGLACGLCSVAEKRLGEVFSASCKTQSGLLARTGKSMAVYIVFSLCVVFFTSAVYRADWQAVFSAMASGWEGLPRTELLSVLSDVGLDGSRLSILVMGCALVLAIEGQGTVSEWIRLQAWPLRWGLYYSLAAAILFFGAFGQSVFIYQQY